MLLQRTGEPVKTTIKIPHHIRVKDRYNFFMTGIYEPRTDKTTCEKTQTVSICPTVATDGHSTTKIHNIKLRMSTIFNKDVAWF